MAVAGLASCTGTYELPNPPAQSNPAEVPFDINNLSVASLSVNDGAVINLTEANANSKLVPVALAHAAEWPANYLLDLTMNVTYKGKTAQVPTTTVNDTVYVEPDVFNDAFYTITKDPSEATVDINFTPKAKLAESNSSFLLGGPGYTLGDEKLTIKPFDPAIVIEDTYILVLGDERITLQHNSSESVYDDPNFSVVKDIVTTANSLPWYVTNAAGNVKWAGEGESGTMVEGATGSCMYVGPVMFSFNMETKAFKFYVAYPQLYVPGNANGWSQAASTPVYTSDYVNYNGFIHADGEFKFCATLGWDVNWGDAGDGKLAPGAANIKVGANGCYYVTANLGSLTYTTALMTSCGVIGDATPNGWDGQTNLVQDAANPMIYKGEIEFKGSGEWKIRFNDNWDYNLGGNVDNLTVGGDNIKTPGAGKKTVTLDLSKFPYTVTVR